MTEKKGQLTLEKESNDNLSVALVPNQKVDAVTKLPPPLSSASTGENRSTFCVSFVRGIGFVGVPFQIPISPWLWGGIYVRARAAEERFNASMRTAYWTFFLCFFAVTLVLGQLLDSNSINSWLNFMITFGSIFACMKGIPVLIRPRFEKTFQTDLECTVQDLAPFIGRHGGHKLSLEVVDRPIECYEKKHNFEFHLNPLTDQERYEGHQDNALLLWPSEDGSICKGEVETRVLHRWYMLSSVPKWKPTALQGHEEIDVCSWGLIYGELDRILTKTFQHFLLMACMFGILYAFILSVIIVYVLDPDDTWPDSVGLSLLASMFVFPWLLYEYYVAEASPEFHEQCKEAVQRLAPQVREKCNYNVEYKVSGGWLYGSTSRLKMFPVEAAVYANIA